MSGSGKHHPFVDRFNLHLRKESSKSKKGQTPTTEDHDVEENEHAGEVPEITRYEPRNLVFAWVVSASLAKGTFCQPFKGHLHTELSQQLLIPGLAESRIAVDKRVHSA